MKTRRINPLLERLAPLVCPVAILLLWECIGRLRFRLAPFLVSFGFDKTRIPDFSFLLPISDIILQFATLFTSGEILPYIWSTMWRSLLGFSLAAGIGIFFGVVLGLSRRSERLFLPSVDAVRTVPPVALLPIIILFFGIDNKMKIVLIFLGCIWPIVINTAHAVKAVDPMYIKVALNSGHLLRSILRRVILPAALPGIFTGFKVSLSLSVILSIVAEMLVGNTGLGFFLNYSKRNLEYDSMFATLFVIAILGWFLNAVLNQVDKRVLRWFYRSREAQLEYHHVQGDV